MPLAAVILAAGQGTRMRSTTPKVLHQIAGRPLVEYAVDAATAVTGVPPVLVVGHGAAQVRETLGARAEYAIQAEQLGTGHAVLQAREVLLGRADTVLVSYADMPLLSERTLRSLWTTHQGSGTAITLLTVILDDPHGFGRVIRGEGGMVQAVIEEVDCTPEQYGIKELNAGVYCFDAGWLWDALPGLPVSRKGEYYLTDAVAVAVGQARTVQAVVCPDADELLGINTRVHLAEAETAMRRRINRRWMEAGVTMVDPAATYVDFDVRIGQDTVVLPNTHLLGNSVIGARCRIGPGAVVQDSRVGDDTVVTTAVLERTAVGPGAYVEPFRCLRGDGVPQE